MSGASATAPYLDTQTGSPTIGTPIAPNAAQLALVNGAADADLPLFHHVDLSTKRTRFDAGFAANINPAWTVDFGMRAEHKDGMKAMGTVSRNTGGDIATIIPDLIDTDTSQVNTSVSYKGERGFLQAGYYGSFFTNKVTSMNWQNWATGPAGTGTMNQMSSTPSNSFNQMNVQARYNLSRRHAGSSPTAPTGATRRTTCFSSTPRRPSSRCPSLDGLVVSSNFGATLTSHLHKVNLTAVYRFNDCDNQTGVHIFQFADAGETAAVSALFPAGAANSLGAVLAQNANANRPYSHKSNRRRSRGRPPDRAGAVDRRGATTSSASAAGAPAPGLTAPTPA